MRRAVVTGAAAVLACCVACGAAPAATSGSAAVAAGPAAPVATAPATPGPSPQAQLVCAQEAQEDLALALGVDATSVGPLQYADGLSTCRYSYPQGGFTLSVHDLPDGAATGQAYAALGARMGRVQEFPLGPAQAFTTTNGSVVMQKDNDVLLVDITDLPDPFGKPPMPRAQAALVITKTILNCWTE